MKSNKFYLGIIAVLLVVCCLNFGIGIRLYNNKGPSNDVDNTEYTLIVCLNGNGQTLYQGTVQDVYFGATRTEFTEASGLRRSIQNAVCIETVGTESQYRAAKLAAQASGGGVENDNNESRSSSDEDNPVEEG